MRQYLRNALLLATAGLLLTGCAYQNDPTGTGRNNILEFRITFADRVNPDRFFYWLVFNFSDDTAEIPRVDIDVFLDRAVIGQFWDTYYVYGRPGDWDTPLPANFYKGFGGNDTSQTGSPPRTDSRGTRYIDILPQRPFDATALEYITATVTSGATNPNNPNDGVLTGNTILYQFRLSDFPTTPFSVDSEGTQFKVAMFVTNRGIDELSNPDTEDTDILRPVVVFDQFLDGHLNINLDTKPEWTEATDPQETIEELRPPRNPDLNGPFRAADLVNWSIKLIRQ